MSNRTTLPRRYLPEGCFPAVSVEAALQHVFPGRGRPPPTGSPLPVALIDVDDTIHQEHAGHVKRMYEKAMRDRQHQFIDEQEDFVRRSAQRWVNIINEFADASSTADAPPEVQAVDGAQENVPDVPMTSQLIGKMVLVLSDSPATSDVEALSESEAVDRLKYLSLRASEQSPRLYANPAQEERNANVVTLVPGPGSLWSRRNKSCLCCLSKIGGRNGRTLSRIRRFTAKEGPVLLLWTSYGNH